MQLKILSFEKKIPKLFFRIRNRLRLFSAKKQVHAGIDKKMYKLYFVLFSAPTQAEEVIRATKTFLFGF